MTVLIQDPAESLDLTTLAHVKSEILGSTDATSDDDFFNRLIREASDTISGLTGRRFERGQYQEIVWGRGKSTIRVSRRPVAEISAISLLGTAVDLTDVEILDPEEGLLYNPAGWDDNARLLVSYRGGFFLPGEDVATSAVEIAGDPTNTLTLTGTLTWPQHAVRVSAGSDTDPVALGDFVSVSGFSAAANNDKHRITDLTTTVLTTDSALVTQATGGSIKTMSFNTLPGELERAAILLVRAGYMARDRDPALSEAVLAGDRFTLHKNVLKDISALLLPWAEPGSAIAVQSGQSRFGGQLQGVRS
jgi:hypothetical protein